jgi:hypothetical protein
MKTSELIGFSGCLGLAFWDIAQLSIARGTGEAWVWGLLTLAAMLGAWVSVRGCLPGERRGE